jgi:c-di-GMP-related signal transduction protein
VIADSITLFDLQILTGQARAFVNVDDVVLRLARTTTAPAERIVVEILETVRLSTVSRSVRLEHFGRQPGVHVRFENTQRHRSFFENRVVICADIEAIT